MPIFNSLGSNYDLTYAWLAIAQLLIKPDRRPQLTEELNNLFDGRTYLLYKGRDAIEFILRAYGIGEGDQVLTQAFACYAIEEGIIRTGAKPIYVDVAEGTLNPDPTTLEAVRRQSSHAKAVLIQHTLGMPAPIQSIKKWCRQHHLLLIEDLAQSIGAKDESGQPLGTLADAIILSFGRDKVVDGVSGGAAILKTVPNNSDQITNLISDSINQKIVVKDMIYPLVTWLIRSTHAVGIGKLLFKILKKSGWLTSPIVSPTQKMAILPREYAPLVLNQLEQLDDSIKKRRELVEEYTKVLKPILSTNDKNLGGMRSKKYELRLLSPDLINRAANLRLPLWADEPDKLTKFLTQKGIYLTDRWYRQPVDCGSLNCHSEYIRGSCPHAEAAAQHVVNLPTHHYIHNQSIQQIAAAIRQYQES